MKRHFAKDFSLKEKLGFLTGRTDNRLYSADGKVKEVLVSDGPCGLRLVTGGVKRKATALPSPSVIANSFDPSLSYLSGKTIADECIESGVDVLLAPGVNIKRTPLNGRNFEYFSEDPFLSGVMGREFIKGVEEKGVGTSLKHYCLNNSEYERMAQCSEADDRTMHEIYLKSFKIALEGKPSTVMCAYNPVNGVFAAENKKILKDILRGEMGFDGVIVSDWTAVKNSARSVKAGLDLRMPSDENAMAELEEGLNNGTITEADVDAAVDRILNLIYRCEDADKKVEIDKKTRHETAKRIAKEGIVLLKNDGILPLKSGRIEVAGWFSGHAPLTALGSAEVETDYDVRPLGEEIKRLLPDAEIVTPPLSSRANAGWYDKYTTTLSYDADTVIYCTGPGRENEGEGLNRFSLRLPEMDEQRIKNLVKANGNVIVVLYSGSAVDVSPWIDGVKGLIFAGYAGEGEHEALSELLCGKANFSGKLSETFPKSLDDTFMKKNMGDGFVDWYNDGIFVGYRYYDREEKEVSFPFGFGLSYTEFEYSDLKAEKISDTDVKVSFSIKNVGKTDGKEAAQVYVKEVFPRVVRPEKELVAFDKVELKAGEKKTVEFTLGFDAFSHYSTVYDDFIIDEGWFEILIGASSRDIRLKEKIKIDFGNDRPVKIGDGKINMASE